MGDMSHHKGIYDNPSLTKKVFANMKRVGTGFSRVVTPLFDTMMVQAVEEVGDLPTANQDTPILNAPSSFQPQRKHKPMRKEKKERNETEMKSSHKAKIAELENRVKKLEEENNSLTKELKSFNSKVESPNFKETVVDKEKSSKQGRKIAVIDADAEVNLENVYNLDIAHEETVLNKNAKKQKGDELEKENAEKQNLEEQQEAEELKRNLEIVPDDEDDVFVNVAPLSSKPPTSVDYKIYKEGKKEHFQITRANRHHQMYLAFSTMLKN
nr:hypothetical protein [Tanacetum cinerariifolium]